MERNSPKKNKKTRFEILSQTLKQLTLQFGAIRMRTANSPKIIAPGHSAVCELWAPVHAPVCLHRGLDLVAPWGRSLLLLGFLSPGRARPKNKLKRDRGVFNYSCRYLIRFSWGRASSRQGASSSALHEAGCELPKEPAPELRTANRHQQIVRRGTCEPRMLRTVLLFGGVRTFQGPLRQFEGPLIRLGVPLCTNGISGIGLPVVRLEC